MSSASAARKSLLTTNSDRKHVLTSSELDHRSRILGILFYGSFHIFGDIRRIFSRVTDPRHPGTIRYKVGDLAFAAILMFIGGLGSRRQITFRLRDGVSAQNFRAVFNAPNCPHRDTINDAFASMDPEEFQVVLCWMVYCLIRSKALNRYRLLDRYFVIAIDGFNVQKNGIYGLTREYSKDENAAKIFHIIMQIAHLWMQLPVKGSLIKHCFARGIGSAKHVAFRLLEAWGNAHMTGEILREVSCWRLQIRFFPDTS